MERNLLLFDPNPERALDGLRAIVADGKLRTSRMDETLSSLEPLMANQKMRARLGLTPEVLRLLIISAGLGLLDQMDRVYGPQRADVLLCYYSAALSYDDEKLKRMADVSTRQRVGQLIKHAVIWLQRHVPESIPGQAQRSLRAELGARVWIDSQHLRRSEATTEMDVARWSRSPQRVGQPA